MDINDKELLKSYADTEEFPLVICDKDYKIKYLNPEAEKTYEKYGGKDLVGRSLNVFMHEEARSKAESLK